MRHDIREGDVVQFRYANSEPGKIRLGRVTHIRDCWDYPLRPETEDRQPDLVRSRWLIGLAMADGTHRQFYDCGLIELQRVGIIRRLFITLSGTQFGDATKQKSPKARKVGRGRPRIS